MSKTLRLLAVLLFLIATFAVASTPDQSTYLGEGSGPTPLCRPGQDCQP
jgi:hypothetical protein